MAGILDFLTDAKQAIGKPYVFGAEGPSSFDCSGLVQWALSRVGIKAPRLAHEQEAWATPVSSPQPGDLAFWGYGSNAHVAIYLGGGQVLNAAEPGTSVRIQHIWTGGSSQPGPRFGRVPGLAGAAGTASLVGGLGDPGLALGGDLPGALAAINANLKNFSDFMANLLKAAAWVANPVNDLRILTAIWGTLIVLGGLVLLAFAA